VVLGGALICPGIKIRYPRGGENGIVGATAEKSVEGIEKPSKRRALRKCKKLHPKSQPGSGERSCQRTYRGVKYRKRGGGAGKKRKSFRWSRV